MEVGEDLSLRYLSQKYDAILLAMGAGEPRDLPVSGRGLEGIYFAMDYLCRQNRLLAGELDEQELLSAKGKRVLVIGGGDTGADCVGTAIRQGAKIVYQFEILPKPMEWDKPFNPDWPYWPQILRTSSSHEEGVNRDWSINTKRFSGSDLRVERAYFSRVNWQKDPLTGRTVMKEVEQSEFCLEVDMVLLALGFLHVKHSKLITELHLALDEKGNIKTNAKYHTNVRGIFAAGDAASGASLVVRAIWHGRQAALAIDDFLR